MASLGDEFRAAREARHLSLSDVSEQIHIRSVYLQSIEAEDWAAIAAPVYVRGFIRTYARFLGLDPESAVARYNELLGDEPPVLMAPSSYAPPSSAGPSVWVWLAGAAALILVAFVGYNYYQFQTGSEGGARTAAKPVEIATLLVTPSPAVTPDEFASAAPSGAPAASAAASAAPAASGAPKNALVIRVSEDSWLQVYVDGVQRIAELVPAGAEKVYHGKTATVRAGNAGGVDVIVGGKDVVERTFTIPQK
jgi:cytoskeletal protein RodZ